MTASYTCLACAEPIQPGQAIIVGVDIGGYPERMPANVVAHRGCEDRARAVVALELAGRERIELQAARIASLHGRIGV